MVWVVVTALMGASGLSASDADYTLSIVAKTGDVIGGKTLTGFTFETYVIDDVEYYYGSNCLAINERGTVAFVGFFSGGAGVFTQSSLVAEPGAVINGRTLTGINSCPAINNHGTVAFGSVFAGGVGIFTQSDLVVKAGDVIGGRTITPIGFAFLGFPAINDAGTIGFVGSFVSETPFRDFGVFTQSDFVATTGDVIGGKTLDWFLLGIPLAINQPGTIAFWNGFIGGGGIFTQSDVVTATDDVIGGLTLGAPFSRPAINAQGTVAFLGIQPYPPGGAAIFTESQLIAKDGDVIGGETVYFALDPYFGPAINDAGTVTFVALRSDPFFDPDAYFDLGVFTQSALVARIGDVIEGKTLTGIAQQSSPVINNRGEIAFVGGFSDGSEGIILAVPRGPR